MLPDSLEELALILVARHYCGHCTGSTYARADATQHQLKHGICAGIDAGTGIHTTNGTGSSTDASLSWLAQ